MKNGSVTSNRKEKDVRTLTKNILSDKDEVKTSLAILVIILNMKHLTD